MCFLLTKLKNKVIEQKVRSLLEYYQVEILHHTPGRVRVRIKNWKENRKLLMQLLDDIQVDPAIKSVAFTEETGSILIYYIQDKVREPATYERWQGIFNKYFR